MRHIPSEFAHRDRRVALGVALAFGALLGSVSPGAASETDSSDSDSASVSESAAADSEEHGSGSGRAESESSESVAQSALPPGHPPISGFQLPGGIRIHGRFDVAYERHGYTDDLSEGKDALRSFHRFLFLERHTKDDPFFFNAEILGLSFYELGAKFRGDLGDPWRLSFSAGKVLIPFGADPLFHHAYGGLVGFDQRILPAVWAEFGVKGTLNLDLDPIGLRIDAFAVRGYALRSADGILDLQKNASPLDDVNFAGGGRISASWGPATLNYSVYGGGLNFDRSMVMQAIDLSLWRLDVPFLRDVALTAGVLRADVFGGDQPDYYHFADYIQVRYYPIGTLFVQYRAGVDTRDNRQGVIADPDRLDEFDTTAHTAAIGWSHAGFSVVVYHVWQLELRNEQDDDFFRVTVAYEF